MISKIIQKEKERQEGLLSIQSGARLSDCPIINTEIIMRIFEHKQSLINLREYMEELIGIFDSGKCYSHKFQFKEDIKELTEMIKKYG